MVIPEVPQAELRVVLRDMGSAAAIDSHRRGMARPFADGLQVREPG